MLLKKYPNYDPEQCMGMQFPPSNVQDKSSTASSSSSVKTTVTIQVPTQSMNSGMCLQKMQPL